MLKYVCNDGSSEDRTLQHLDSTTFTSSKLHHCMVQSSAPVTCGQYLKATSSGPVKGFASIPPRAQWSTHYTFGAFVNVVYHIQIVIEDGYQNQLNVSGTFAGVVEGHTLTWSSVLRYSGRKIHLFRLIILSMKIHKTVIFMEKCGLPGISRTINIGI